MKIPVEFKSQGDVVHGKLYLAGPDSPLPTVLLLQGFPGNEEDVLELGARISQHGVNALTFNYRGTHKSGGVYSIANSLYDIGAAIDHLQEDDRVTGRPGVRADRLVVAGWSYGGGMALTYAARNPRIRSIVAIAGVDHAQIARVYLRDPSFAHGLKNLFDGLKFPAGPVHFAGAAALQELLDDPAPYDFQLLAPALVDHNLLLIGGWDDMEVRVEDHLLPFYRALIANGAHRTQLVALHDDHTFARRREEIAQMIMRWIGRSSSEKTA